jgi:DNA-binding response OmpR family regulator
MKVLLIEDDKKIVSFVRRGLKEEGMTVDAAFDGKDGLYLCRMHNYDVVVLDWMLPGMSGIELCRNVRAKKITTPILMLTARGGIDDMIYGFESGADDYMEKPFSFRELVARLNALHRRCRYDSYGLLKASDLVLDPVKRSVRRDGEVVDLSSKEFELLEYLMRNANTTISTTMIQEHLWGIDDMVKSNVVNVTVHYLRQKIDAHHDTKLIKTVRGSGYRLETNDA